MDIKFFNKLNKNNFFRRNMILFSLILLVITIPITLVEAQEHEHMHEEYEIHNLGTSTITIDGNSSDWSNIPSVTLNLEQPLAQTDDNYTATFKVANSSSRMYFLVQINEKYQAYNFSSGSFDHEATVSLGIAFNLNASSSNHMGAESEDNLATTGYVDMVHWELETDPGTITSGSTGVEGEKGDGVANLDDEYASAPTDRHDDVAENSWEGAWDHTAKTNGSEGTYTFELSRKLITGDANDVQFEEDAEYEATIAFWTPFETSEGWTDSGHFTSSEISLHLVFGNPPSEGAPGFELVSLTVGLLTMSIIIRKRK